jgi:chromosome segregation ATPase
MGFLDRFKKEKKPEIVEPSAEESVRLGMGELQGWFESIFSGDVDKSKSRGSALFQGVMDSFSDLKNSFVALESSRFNGTERIHAAANMIKDSYVKKAYPVLGSMERVSRETDMNHSGLKSFTVEASKILDDLKKTTPKQAVLMSRYFKKQSDPIVSSMKKTEESIDALKKWLDEEPMMRLSENIKSMIDKQLLDIEQMKSLDKKKEDIRKEMSSIKNNKQNNESEYLELLKGKKWEELNSIEKEIKNVKNDIVSIENEITNEISPMKRPLKKLEHILRKQDVMFNHKGFLKGFVQDPFGSVKTKNGEDSLRRFLFTMNKMVHDNKIELKDKEVERLDILLEKMVRDIPELKRKHSELLETRKEMERKMDDLSGIVKKKQDLERGVDAYSKHVSDMEKEVKDISREQERIKEAAEKGRKELEKLILKETGREVEIVG